MYYTYLGTVEYTIHNANGYIIQLRDNTSVGMVKVRIGGDLPWKMTLAVWKIDEPVAFIAICT